MKITDFNTVFINLESRKDRKEEFLNQYKKISNKNPIRIDAVNGHKLNDKNYRKKISRELNIPESKLREEFWTDRSNFKTMINDKKKIMGRVGCFLSHMKCMKLAIEKNWSNILVLEDDIKVLPHSKNRTLNLPKNSDIIYLGGMFWHLNKQPPNTKNDLIRINPLQLKLIGTFSYCVINKQTIKDIYNLCNSVFIGGKGHDKHPDWRSGKVKMRAQAMDFFYINYFQKLGNCFVVNPIIFSHNEDLGSNISPHYGTSSKRWKHHFYYHPDQKQISQDGGSKFKKIGLYQFIFNPVNQKYINIYSKKAKNLLLNYLKFSN